MSGLLDAPASRAGVVRGAETRLRASSPSATIIDSHSVKPKESDSPRGYDAAKRMMGRKRPIVVHSEGLLLYGVVHAASIQDGAVPLLGTTRTLFPWLKVIWTDSGDRAGMIEHAFDWIAEWPMEIVTRDATAAGFEVLPRRWVVERTFAWLGCNRRLAKDFEATVETAPAYPAIALIRLMIRRVARL